MWGDMGSYGVACRVALDLRQRLPTVEQLAKQHDAGGEAAAQQRRGLRGDGLVASRGRVVLRH